MADVGLDGNNAPAQMEGVDFEIWMGIQARVFTHYRREPFRPEYSIGLSGELMGPSLNQAELRRRVRTSFGSLEGFNSDDLEAVIAGSRMEIRVRVDA